MIQPLYLINKMTDVFKLKLCLSTFLNIFLNNGVKLMKLFSCLLKATSARISAIDTSLLVEEMCPLSKGTRMYW